MILGILMMCVKSSGRLWKLHLLLNQKLMFSTTDTLEIMVSALEGIRPSMAKVLKEKGISSVLCVPVKGNETTDCVPWNAANVGSKLSLATTKHR
jgi:hypothetical protein